MLLHALLIYLLLHHAQLCNAATQSQTRKKGSQVLNSISNDTLSTGGTLLVPAANDAPSKSVVGLPVAAQLGSKSHLKGTAAVAQLARNSTRARKIARNYKINVATLRARLAHDNDLAVDIKSERLVYVCGGLELPKNKAVRMPDVAAFEDPTEPPFQDAFKLHSRAGSRNIIYLDFDGHSASETAWRPTGTIVTPPYSIDDDPAFNLKELSYIVVSYEIILCCNRCIRGFAT